MENYENELSAELEYFGKIIEQIRLQLSEKIRNSERSKGNLLSSRKEMWNDATHSANDFDRIVEMSQYLEQLNAQTAAYFSGTGEIQRLERLQASPYFARIDFTEAGYEQKEKIYIGRYSLTDNDSHNMLICDWRSPIAGVFYRFELGAVHYEAPVGVIYGNVALKRQYEIKRGKFEYFFDANVQIVDEFLRSMLSKNASPKMTAIVETIQKDQDMIIRDSQNELLMVQGSAGSGKTSVALHRAAYLMYQGLSSGHSANNIVILSPNNLFAKYISNVLPELGEDNVEMPSFEDICSRVSDGAFKAAQTRNQFYEEFLTCTSAARKHLLITGMEFKASSAFTSMLERLVLRYQRKMVPFSDIYYNRRLIFDRHLLKARLLARGLHIPVAARLKQLEVTILEKLRQERKYRITELESFIAGYPEHIYEARAFARMLSIRENGNLLSHIRSFTEIDYNALYLELFHNKDLFYALAKGLELPENIEDIRRETAEALRNKAIYYGDVPAMTFLKIKMDNCSLYKDIKQVIIDEAQDYYPIHFEILKALFPKAKYTVLGDVNQTVEKQASLDFYGDVQRILAKSSAALLTLSKSFRCTNEIIAFSKKFMDKPADQECFSRKGVLPEIISCEHRSSLDGQLTAFVRNFLTQDYKSVCILCKSMKEAAELYARLKGALEVALVDDTFASEISGVFITSIYMAKGLEFDAVLIYDADDAHYRSPGDKKLLYIAATRALHRLAVFYTGKESRFLA